MKKESFLTKLLIIVCLLTWTTPPIMGQQNEGIGTKTPLARLHVADSNVLFSGPVAIAEQTAYSPPVQGAGCRLMWYPQKAAFRVGQVSNNQWDKDSIGIFSFATGSDNVAAGPYTFASGYHNRASGYGSIVIGSENHATFQDAIAIGKNNWATGHAAVAIGYMCKATNYFSTALGFNAISSNEGSTAMGYNTAASGQASTAMGYFTQAIAPASLAAGFHTIATGMNAVATGNATLASGLNSTAMGLSNIALFASDLVIGKYNDTAGSGRSSGRLFEIGNGSSEKQRSNAMTIFEDGRIGIGTTNPSQRLEVFGGICAYGPITMCSDNRVKTGIVPLGNTLPSVLALRGIYFYWSNRELAAMPLSAQRQIGISAQELEKQFPELVVTNEQGFKSVDYARLAPVLLEAIKEQQREIENLKERMGRWEVEIKKTGHH